LIAPMPSFFPAEAEIAVNLPVLVFSVLVSVLTGVMCGLWPALRVSRTDLRHAMNSGAHKLAGRRGARATHVVLLTVQVAMTLLLLACSGATLRKVFSMMHEDVGYDLRNLASVNLVMREDSGSDCDRSECDVRGDWGAAFKQSGIDPGGCARAEGLGGSCCAAG
jgi:hypothetical protein